MKTESKGKQLSTLEMKKMLLSKMSDNELGSLVKNMELIVNLSGGNIYGDGLMMSCDECLKRPYTTDVNVLRIQDLMLNSFLRKNRFEESEINEIVSSRITN